MLNASREYNELIRYKNSQNPDSQQEEITIPSEKGPKLMGLLKKIMKENKITFSKERDPVIFPTSLVPLPPLHSKIRYPITKEQVNSITGEYDDAILKNVYAWYNKNVKKILSQRQDSHCKSEWKSMLILLS